MGRRGPLLIGLAVFAAGSLGCALASAPWHVIAWRVVQALGASAGVALARAMIRDLYNRDEAARVLSVLMTVMAVAPLVGPSLGAQVLALAGWRLIFWTLVAVGGATFVAVLALPESLPLEQRTRAPMSRAFATYGGLLQNRRLLGFSAAIGFYYAGLFGVIAGAPFAFVDYYGLSPRLYALVFASGVFGLMGTNLANARLVPRIGSERMLLYGAAGAAVAGGLFAFLTVTGLGGVWGLALANFLFAAVNGLILAIASALSQVEQDTGSASAVLGAIQYGSGMLGSALIGWFADGTPAPMGYVAALAGCGSLLCALVAGRMRLR